MTGVEEEEESGDISRRILRRMISFERLGKKSMMCDGVVVAVVLAVIVEMFLGNFFTQIL
jgi:hypothetical protein